MKYYPLNPTDKLKARVEFEKLINSELPFTLKQHKDTRTTRQNSALHLYFTFIADELNGLGMTFQYRGISGKEFEVPYTPEIVKERIWKPIQSELFGTDTTTKLTTKQMDTIIDVLNKFFAERGVELFFPSFETLTGNY